jgi:glycosyltransferase involved in cell wall biosynthesis
VLASGGVSVPCLSVVLPVYNKADILREVVDRLRAEAPAGGVEVVAVDDGSLDGSRELLLALRREWSALRVVMDEHNRGPSLRLNEGVAMASAPWVFLMDADALLVPGALAGLLALRDASGAEVLHAQVVRSASLAEAVAAPPWQAEARPLVSDHPLATVLSRRRIVRMAWLVERNCFLLSGGADPGVFIQDESLPLRLAAAARRICLSSATAAREPPVRSNLSQDRRQQHHDRFLCHYRFLLEHPALEQQSRRLLLRRCLSAARRAARSGMLPSVGPWSLGFHYAAAGLGWPGSPLTLLAQVAADLDRQPGVRRPETRGS